MRIRKVRVLIASGVVVSALAAVVLAYAYIERLNALDYLKNPERVAFILNLSQLPPSVRDIECSATAITDVIVTCAFRVAPADYQQLLVGWDFKSERVSGHGRSYGMDAPVGPEFEAVTRHVIHPASFKNGGLVNLVTNKDHTLIVANRFEE